MEIHKEANSHYTVALKVRETAKIRKRYNQVPHLTQDTTWESNQNTINIHKHENHVGVDKATLMFLL